MTVFFLLLGILSVCRGIYTLVRRLFYLRYTRKNLTSAPGDYQPKVGLIVPCKGIDHGFEENIMALMDQDYRDYHIVFVTGSPDDPAYTMLKK